MIYDLVVIGAGPAGVEAALQAAERKINYLLIEQDDVGSLIARTMANKKFYHLYGRNTATLKGSLAFPDRLKGYELVTLWKEQLATLPLNRGETAQSISRDDQGVCTIETDRGQYQSKHILLTSGVSANPRRLGVSGELDNPKVHQSLDYYQDFRGEQIVIVGGGNSAVETAVYCGPYNQVTMVVRKTTLHDSVTELNRKALDDLVTQKKVTILWNSTVTSIDPHLVTLSTNNQLTSLPYDRLFVQIGFNQPTDFLASLGIEIKDDRPVYNDRFETNVPGLYIAGDLTGADSIIEAANQAYDIIHHLSL